MFYRLSTKLSAVIIILLSIVGNLFAQTDSVTVTSPNGGESWVQGTVHAVTWDYKISELEQVKINLYKDLDFVDELTITTCTGSYDWRIADDLAPSNLYRIGIVSCNDSTVSDMSDVNFSIFASLGIPALTAPTNGSVTDDFSPAFEWSAVDGAENYLIYIADNMDFTECTADTVTATTFIPSTDMSYGTYWWKVAAANNLGTGKESEVRTFTIMTLPSAPVLISPSNGSATSNLRPVFQWNAVEGTEKYIVFIADNAEFAESLADTVDTVSFTPDYNMDQKTYWWKVKAVNDLGSSEDSNVWSFTIMELPEAPMLVSPDNGSTLSTHLITFKWNKVHNAINYTICITDVNGGFTENSVTDTSFTKPINYGKYWWKVRAVNVAGAGEWSWPWVYTGVAFDYVDSGLTGVAHGATSWGDFNNDGLLDLLLTGYTGSNSVTKIYRNNGDETFTDINAGLPGISNGSAAEWGDYDNDGYLDILLVGGISRIYRNNGNGTFTNINAGLAEVWGWAAADWGDYDNDGYLDILLTGASWDEDEISRVYHNNGDGTFTDIRAGLQPVSAGSVDWGDYNNDGYLDILLTGSTAGWYNNISIIYCNNGDGTFTDINAGLPGVIFSSVAWGDYDNDGYLDILFTGNESYYQSSPRNISLIFRNNGDGTFTDISTFVDTWLLGEYFSSVSWGDFDNDGYLDILITGYTGTVCFSRVYRNKGDGSFIDITVDLPGLFQGSADWCDYNNDGKLDFLISGSTYPGPGVYYISYLYKNISSVSNNPPSAPTNLMTISDGDKITLSWDRSTDNETPQSALSYNIYLGSSPAGSEIVNPMSDISNGFRKIVSIGNSNEANFKTVKWLSSGTYYWGVQAIDHSYAGSQFSAEKSFTISAPDPVVPVATDATDFDYYSFIACWNQTGDKGYCIDVAKDIEFTHFVVGYENRNAHNANYIEVTNILPDSTYYYRIRSYNADGKASENSNIITVYGIHDPFEDIGFSITTEGPVSWGDYDNDGWLDLLFTHQIYKNNRNDTFTLINTGLPGEGNGEFGDYNNDGWLDILISSRNPWYLKIYRNNGDGTFTDANVTLPSYNSYHKWGDFDNDGLLDIFMTDNVDYVEYCYVYKNNGDNTFTEYELGIDIYVEGLNDKAYIDNALLTDYNNDGTLDLFIQITVYHYNESGDFQSLEMLNKLYKNDGNMTFTENPDAVFQNIGNGTVAWGDYDNDGFMDLLLSGQAGNGYINTAVYKNNQDGTFSGIISLKDFNYGGGIWIDYDNDGLLDFIITGWSIDAPEPYFIETVIYRNNGDDSFTPVDHNIPNFRYANIAWGDFNNDKKNDIVISGTRYNYDDDITIIYRNNNHYIPDNTVPDPPANLSGVAISSDEDWELELSWDDANDTETPRDALTYNVFVGTTPITSDILSPSSDLATGYRRVALSGNSGSNNTIVIHDLEPGRYYWSVQAVDQCYKGSVFACEQYIDISEIEDTSQIPVESMLFQNYPNPFNPDTVIKYSISNDAQVKLNIFDTTGREVSSLVDQKQDKGWHEVKYSAEAQTSGLYFYRLSVDGKVVSSRKMMLIK